MYRLVGLLVLVSGACGQITLQGSCSYADIGGYVTNLNASRMIGTWNQIARIDGGDETGECSRLNLSAIYDNTGQLTGLHATWTNVMNKNETSLNGIITPDPSIDGLYYMNFTNVLMNDFVVQSTNYTDYAVLYACRTLSPGNATHSATKSVWAWQYHKKAELSSSEVTSIQALANSNPDLNGTTWKYVSHNKTACGGGVTLAVPHILVVLATVFISKEFV